MGLVRWARYLTALQACLALLLALFAAPFQHVHTGHSSGSDHDHSGLLHSHFYHFYDAGRSGDGQGGLQFDDDDDDGHAAARSLDTFMLVLTGGFALFLPTRGPVLLFAPAGIFQPAEVVEECGHDPPLADRSIPRAPPI